ncbi:exosome nuclease subunit RRP6 [Aspergillus melleus]|uniref:exosome nuclease subunit RRP6 n=1 Tax=Aspergillus melleus TaxID=138277 RepID=UPI001E8DDF54|nr:exosome nuclease subunit [Aspergillus melleus]KAH8423926.1 exosome nuclease subunit [Aspergillus melleus]
MDSAADFPPFQARLTSSLVQMTRTVGQLSAEDLTFHRSSSSELTESLDEQSDRILSLTSSILKAATAGTDLAAPSLQDEDSIEDNWRGVVDVIDALLEKADACLDEFTGVIKRLSPSQQEQSAAAAAKASKKPPTKFPSVYDYGPSKIPKPQLEFKRAVDNTDVSPFKPLLHTKFHATVPLEESEGYVNPYEPEIRAAKYPPSTYEVSPPVDYLPFESTTATFVDTMEGVMDMLKELKKAKEIAIDLEHHDVHSYHGLVSLMQISTRDKDWVVDTLKPWREELQVLNEVFADPAILKVLHGSSMDIIWLQRDLGLYVVGMFDTFHAACALNYPKRSLKFLLQKIVNFEADKRYQMADWRIRPLPTGMFDYARSDTHYLLHIYDHLRNELVENSVPGHNLIDYVQDHSKEEALQRYERSVYDAATGQGPGGWYDYLCRNPAVLSKEQFAVFKAVHQWRDQVAREEDEGVQCVFPKHILFKVANVMPVDMGTLFRTLSPVTPITKDRASDLLETIKQAKIEGATGPEWRDVYVKPTKTKQTAPVADQDPLTDQEDHPTAGRYEVSQFWGGILNSQEPLTPPEYSAVASAEALRLSLPLPPMPRTVSEVQHTTAPAATKPEPTTPAETPEAPENKIFTVKELGGPRKRKATPVETTPQGPPVLDDISQSVDLSEMPSKKPRRKEKKNKSASGSNTPQPEAKSEETPFNYETADSVLHGQTTKGSGLPKKAPFNPYAKAMDAPSGARKQKREMPGKTFTFR